MPVNRVYRNVGERDLVSYDYIDVAEGTGIIVFYGYNSVSGATTTYGLTTESIYSNDLQTNGTSTTAGFSLCLDLDFDLSKFNSPRNMLGTAIATLGIGGTGAASQAGEVYGKVKLRHWDGTTETEIASAQTETFAVATGDGSAEDYCNIPLVIDELVHFKKGEILRATVEVWGKKTDAGSFPVTLLHDPKNRSTGTPTHTSSLLQLNIPFKLDL